MSKRLRELAKCDIDADQTAEDYCPAQEPPTEEIEPKTCAECKHFKTYRTMTSLLVSDVTKNMHPYKKEG